MSRSLFALIAVTPAVAACQLWATPPADRFGQPPADDAVLAAGKLVYDTHCARCHGLDGKDDTYPFIATLDGIGKRYSLDRILEETWATGFVAPQQFSPEQQRAMAAYVATL